MSSGPVLEVAVLIRDTLSRYGMDVAAVADLGVLLGCSGSRLLTAAGSALDLGVCGPPGDPLIYCVPLGPLAAGFTPEYRRGRLIMRLGGSGRRGSLVLSGERLGSAPAGMLEDYLAGAGPVTHTVARLSLMARRWLVLPGGTTTAERTRWLFELIANTWRSAPEPTFSSGPLRIHHGWYSSPVATQFWAGDTPTNGVELVTHHDHDHDHDHDQPELVNIYPAGTYPKIFAHEDAPGPPE